jgi:heat shock protein HslJ
MLHRKGENLMTKIKPILLTLLIVSGLLLSACTSQGIPAGLPGTSWKLVSYGPAGNRTPAAAGIDTSLDFGKDGTINGNLGCNCFSGNYQVTNGKIVLTMMISTMMACVGPKMNQEDAGLKIMNGTVRYTVAANKLTLYTARGDNSISFLR